MPSPPPNTGVSSAPLTRSVGMAKSVLSSRRRSNPNVPETTPATRIRIRDNNVTAAMAMLREGSSGAHEDDYGGGREDPIAARWVEHQPPTRREPSRKMTRFLCRAHSSSPMAN